MYNLPPNPVFTTLLLTYPLRTKFKIIFLGKPFLIPSADIIFASIGIDP